MREPTMSDCFSEALIGCAAGTVSYVGSVTAVLASVPRKDEGGRSVVDLPWEVFAWLPFWLAIIGGLGLYIAVRIRWRRPSFCFLVSACLMIGFLTIFSIGLLRRDYLGKF